MHILVAFDKFKHCMSAGEANAIVREAILAVRPTWTVTTAPLSDGGEGFVEILTRAVYGEIVKLPVLGPRLEPLRASLGLVEAAKLPEAVRVRLKLPPGGPVAIVEMAEASGLQWVPEGERDPWKTSSFGTGQLIAEAADRGVRAVILGIGGSATIDLGLGALSALGLEVVDQDGRVIGHPTPADWSRVLCLRGELWPHLPMLHIACDVHNPLLGPNGAVRVFGAQKGLPLDDMPDFERGLGSMAKRLCTHFDRPRSLIAEPGAGAAGGISFGLRVAADAEIVPGFDLVASWLDLSAKVQAADLVLTGEGCFDASSLDGKGPGSLLSEAVRQGKPAKVIAGQVAKAVPLPAKTTANQLAPPGYSLERSLAEGKRLLASQVKAIFGN